MNVHITMDVPEHNALAPLLPFVPSILSPTRLCSDYHLPHSEIYCMSHQWVFGLSTGTQKDMTFTLKSVGLNSTIVFLMID